MKPDEVDGVLAATLEDHHLSRGEKHALEELLRSDEVRPEELAYFRHRAFALAREQMPTHGAREILDWLEGVNKILLPPPAKEPTLAEVHFSPGPACLEAIKRNLADARRSVDICVFTITDDSISERIVAAHRRGVSVRVITDNEKSLDEGSDARGLERVGVAVRVDRSEAHMHHKYAIFDEEVLLTGSYNWTRSAALYNRENLVVTREARLVVAFGRDFETLWGDLERWSSS